MVVPSPPTTTGAVFGVAARHHASVREHGDDRVGAVDFQMGEGFADEAQHLAVAAPFRFRKGQRRNDVLEVLEGPLQFAQHVMQGVEKILRVRLEPDVSPVQRLLVLRILRIERVFPVGAQV